MVVNQSVLIVQNETMGYLSAVCVMMLKTDVHPWGLKYRHGQITLNVSQGAKYPSLTQIYILLGQNI